MVVTQTFRGVPAANEMMFLYADGVSVVARTLVTLVALGQNSNNGRQTVRGSPLMTDLELGKVITGGLGEIALDDPLLKKGYEDVAQVVKLGHPRLVPWGGVPGQPTPLFPGGVNPSPGLAYPDVPVIAELFDDAFRPMTIAYPARTGIVVTTWDRPPVAELPRRFYRPSEFLDELAGEYQLMQNRRLPIVIKLTRMGSVGSAPALDPVFVEMASQFARSKAFPRGLNPLDKTAKDVAAQLSGALGIPGTGDLRPIYLDALRRIARLAGANPHNLPSGRFSGPGPLDGPTLAMLRAFGMAASPFSLTPSEDWAALGTAVFLAGAVLFGYRAGSLIFGTSPTAWELRASLRQA